MSLRNKLLSFIESKAELKNSLDFINSPLKLPFTDCFKILDEPNQKLNTSLLLFKIDVILDTLHDDLNTGHWSDVPIELRHGYTVCSFIKAVILLEDTGENIEIKEQLKIVLKCLDLGLLLGAPLDINSELLVLSAAYITEEINKFNTSSPSKIINQSSLGELEQIYKEIKAEEILTLECPSIEKFNSKFFQPQIPVKLTGCMSHWPALKKWSDISYLQKVAGNRTVPIEIGSHYADEDWAQKLMPFNQFIKDYFFNDKNEKVGYLAQHNLFDQIAELKEDICIPEYCALSKNYDESTEPDVNAWFGPKNTVSPLHQDPKNNILTQIFGTKQLIIFAPSDAEFLYPHPDELLTNTAQVNPLQPNLTLYPLFNKAKMFKCLLKPGEMIFMPEKWWHHVSALEKSFSVSFWWQ